MKLGPCHILKDRTFRILQGSVDDLQAKLAAQFLPHSYQHFPVNFRVAPPIILDPDPKDERSSNAAERVVTAYQRARTDDVRPEPGVWDTITTTQSPFLEALEEGAVEAVQEQLGKLFQSNLIWGLGRVHENVVHDMQARPHESEFQHRVTDTLVSLAEAVAALHLKSVEQQGTSHFLEALNVDLERILEEVERRTGLDFSFPAVGAPYGVQIAGKMVTVDSLTHGYTVHRLAQLGARHDSIIAEIGGGYGCLACQCHRAGFSRYTIYDLPWVAALQGYFLIMALPPRSVRLYGESEGSVQVLPWWRFHELPPRSVDFVVNTNSMPEMPAATARAYLERIRSVLCGRFLSVNQEAGVTVPLTGPQQWVNRLVEEVGGFRLLCRSRYWMFQGYAEEVYEVDSSLSSFSEP